MSRYSSISPLFDEIYYIGDKRIMHDSSKSHFTYF